MKRPQTHRVIPTLIMTAATAVPVGTTIGMLTHVQAARSPLPLSQLSAGNPLPASVPAPSRPAASKPSAHVYSGPIINQQFGPVQATITVKSNRIVNVAITTPTDSHSADINSQAVPILVQETLASQSAIVNTVSGATLTSDAYTQSLQAAIVTARSRKVFT